MKFKHGDRVTREILGKKISDARISIDKNGLPFICQNEIGGDWADGPFGYWYGWPLNNDFTRKYVTYLKLAEKTLDNLVKGDVLIGRDSERVLVIERLGSIVFLSADDDFDTVYAPFTIQEVKKLGYKVEIVEEN